MPQSCEPQKTQSRAIYLTQTLTFCLMLASNHHFEGIEEKVTIFIPLEFRDSQDIRSLWRVAMFEYLDGAWEWVQVMSDHVASHCTMLAVQGVAKPAMGMPQNRVSIIVPPMECSQTIYLPSAQLSSKGGVTTRPKGSNHHVKVDPSSTDPPGPWKDWDQYLQHKPGALTLDQVTGVITQHHRKINQSVAPILELFDWYTSARMLAVIGHFDHRVGSAAQGSEGQRWCQALMGFAYRNVTHDVKQLVEVLHCDLQVAIHKGLMETQRELLETVGSFVDHFQSEMATLSPLQMHALLNHLRTRWDGGQALLDAIHQGETSTRPESFLQNGPSQLLLDFYSALPDHQINIQWESTALFHFEIEVDNTATVLRARMMPTWP